MLSVKTLISTCRTHLIFIGLFSGGINLLYFTPVLYMLQIYDRIIPSRGFDTLIFLSILALGALGVMAMLETARQRLLARMSTRIERLMSDQVICISFREHAGRTGTIHARDLDTLRVVLTGPGMLALLDLPWLPLFLFTVFLVHPYLGLLVLIGSLGLAGMSLLAQRRMVTDLQSAELITKYANARIDAALVRSDTAVALGMADNLAHSLAGERWLGATVALKANLGGATLASLAKSMRIGMQCAVLGLGGLLAILGDVNPSAVFAGSILGARTLQPMDQLIASWKSLAQGREAYRRLKQSIDAAPAEARAVSGPGISVRDLDVALAPDADPIVQDASFDVAPGEIVGIIGPSGAGKSTLLKALAGIATVQGGSIVIGGEAIVGDPSAPARAEIGYLPQTVDLLHGSVFDNISRFERYSGRDITRTTEDAVLAAMAVGAHDFITDLRGAYQYEVGVDGTGLSGGQAQRIGLARAFYRWPPVLLLDEPNANLDGPGEQQLIAALGEARRRGASAVFVAQRTSLLAVCDRVILMSNGRIALDSALDEVLRITGIELPRGTGQSGPDEARMAEPSPVDAQ